MVTPAGGFYFKPARIGVLDRAAVNMLKDVWLILDTASIRRKLSFYP
jgi:hypothetical protein